ncbi:hypothetical protein [Peribacillus sp. YIM B13477]
MNQQSILRDLRTLGKSLEQLQEQVTELKEIIKKHKQKENEQ